MEKSNSINLYELASNNARLGSIKEELLTSIANCKQSLRLIANNMSDDNNYDDVNKLHGALTQYNWFFETVVRDHLINGIDEVRSYLDSILATSSSSNETMMQHLKDLNAKMDMYGIKEEGN